MTNSPNEAQGRGLADSRLKVAVVMARCQHKGGVFGIRFERIKTGEWEADWAFPMAESAARREGYDQSTLDGDFCFADAYPGCPWCGSSGIFHCGHDSAHVGCWNGKTTSVRCPWCERSTQIDGQIEQLTSGGDR
jgi:hypothetical protein